MTDDRFARAIAILRSASADAEVVGKEYVPGDDDMRGRYAVMVGYLAASCRCAADILETGRLG